MVAGVKAYTYPAVDATSTDTAKVASLVDRLQKHDMAAVELSTKLRHYISTIQAMNDAGRDLCNDFVKLYSTQEEDDNEAEFFELTNELKAHVDETDVGPLNNLVETLQRSVVTPLERWITETRATMEQSINRFTQASTQFEYYNSKMQMLEKREVNQKGGLTPKEKERVQRNIPKMDMARDGLASNKRDAEEALGGVVGSVWDTFDPLLLRFLDFRSMYHGHCHAQAHTCSSISVVQRRHQELATTKAPFMEFYPRTGYKSCEGWLMVKRGKLLAVWRRRYAVLRGTSLEMYESREDARSGSRCERVRLVCDVREREGQPKGFGFDVVGDTTGSALEYLADTESEAEAARWMDAMAVARGGRSNSVGGYPLLASHFNCDCALTLATASAGVMGAPEGGVAPLGTGMDFGGLGKRGVQRAAEAIAANAARGRVAGASAASARPLSLNAGNNPFAVGAVEGASKSPFASPPTISEEEACSEAEAEGATSPPPLPPPVAVQPAQVEQQEPLPPPPTMLFHPPLPDPSSDAWTEGDGGDGDGGSASPPLGGGEEQEDMSAWPLGGGGEQGGVAVASVDSVGEEEQQGGEDKWCVGEAGGVGAMGQGGAHEQDDAAQAWAETGTVEGVLAATTTTGGVVTPPPGKKVFGAKVAPPLARPDPTARLPAANAGKKKAFGGGGALF